MCLPATEIGTSTIRGLPVLSLQVILTQKVIPVPLETRRLNYLWVTGTFLQVSAGITGTCATMVKLLNIIDNVCIFFSELCIPHI